MTADSRTRIGGGCVPPVPLAPRSDGPDDGAVDIPGQLLGREREMATLVDAISSAEAGQGRLVLLSGDAGIGKTRLADAVAVEARRRGARVLWGRCWEAGGAPAYWPWLQAIRAYIDEVDADTLLRTTGTSARNIAHLVPEIQGLIPGLTPIALDETEASRFAMFEAVSRFIRAIAVSRPTVMILDDLHAADEPTLRLLLFLASEMIDSRLLIVATYRENELDRDDPRAVLLGEADRSPIALRLTPRPLTAEEVARYVEAAAGPLPTPGVAEAIYRGTEGNPLFVAEVVRLLADEGRLASSTDAPGRPMSIPAGVRAVLGRRLARLSEPCRELLGRACVFGVDVPIELLARVEDASVEEIADRLEEAVGARVLNQPAGLGASWRFSHALIREVLYTALPASARLRLHRRIGEALEQSIVDGREPPLAELAHHFAAARAGQQAVMYAERAAEQATAIYAHEEAVRLYRLALAVADLDDALHCRLLLGLGEAATRAGDQPTAREAFLAAAAFADRLNLVAELARAAIGYGGRYVWRRAGDDEKLIPLLERALTSLRPSDDRLRILIQARLAGALRDEPDLGPRAALSAAALEGARRLGHAPTLVAALLSRYTAILGPDSLSEMAELSDEAMRVARAAGDPELLADSQLNVILLANTFGDGEAIRSEVERAGRLARELHQPSNLWFYGVQRTNLALIEGRLADVEALLPETRNFGERGQAWDARFAYAVGLFMLRREQERLSEIVDMIRAAVEDYPGYRLFTGVAAFVEAVAGNRQEAVRILRRVASDDFAFIPRDWGWLFGMSFLAEAALVLDDQAIATALGERLRPYSGMFATGSGDISGGPVDLTLGRLAAASGRDNAARACAHLGALLFETRIAVARAEVLAQRARDPDQQVARDLLGAALETCRALGLVAVELAARRVLLGLDGGAQQQAETAASDRLSGARPWSYRREGDFWAIGAESVVRLRDAKGLRYLAQLLASPGREFHVLDLAGGRGPGHAGDADAARDAGLPVGAGEHGDAAIDSEARAAYRDRIRELGAEIDQAESFNDPERAAIAQRELEALEAELRAAFGLGGRARTGVGPAERARQSVTKAIRESLARIRDADPALGGHLARTVRTGTYCIYDPDPAAGVHWVM